MTIHRVLLSLIAALGVASWSLGQDTPAGGGAAASDSAGGRHVYIVPIRSQITDLTRDFLERCLTEIEAEGRQDVCVVLDIDTPGGAVSSAIDISSRLKNLNMHTVAWVNPEAISAGAMISLACDEIVVAPRSKIGDCAAIMVGPQGMQSLGKTERAKIDSYILAEFRDSARANGYPLALSEAMVTLGPAIYKVENTETNEVRYAYADDLHEFGLTAPGEDADDDAEPTAWKLGKKVLDKDALLTMLGSEALEYGFAKKEIADETELAAYLGTTPQYTNRFEANWSEQLVAFLISPAVRGILTILMLMGIYSEMQSPGLGLPGLLGVTAAAILFGAPFMAGLADILDLLLIVAGVGLLFVEVFVVPGFGFFGLAGLALMMIGLLMTFVQDEPGPGFWPQLPGTWDMLREGVITIFASMCVTAVGIFFLTKHFGHLPMFNRLVLADGVSSGAATSPSPASPPTANELGVTTGDQGVVTSGCHPIGRAQINDQLVDVVSSGQWIEKDSRVKVVEVHGNRIVVEEA